MQSHRNGLVCRSCLGRIAGQRYKGFSRNLGVPVVSTVISRWGTGLSTPGPRWRTRRRREQNPSAPVVPPSEGNEARRDGQQDVGAPRSTVEAGEPEPPGPWGGKGVPSHGTVGGKHGGCIETRVRVNE